MAKRATSLPGLAAVVGEKHVLPPGGYEVDGMLPQSAVRPGSYEEVCAVLRHADGSGLAVIPRGGGTMMGVGNVPSRYDLALDLTRLDAVVEFEPADLTITCQAGITLGRLREATAAAGQSVPFDPDIPDAATVGGVLAVNATGAARSSLGAPRDLTIGMRVVTADGRLTRAGGKVVKNVAGYDLCKLYIGSLGTLGVIVEATFKTAPLPKATRTLACEFGEAESACRVANRAYSRGLSVRSATATRAGAGWRLDIALAGTEPAVERSAREIEALAGGAETSAAEGPRPPGGPGLTALRLVTLPTRLPALLEALADAAPDATVAGHPIVGACLLVAPAPDVIEPARRIAAEHGATCVVGHCPPEKKRAIDVFGDEPAAINLMRRVKREFDPNGTLSPGRAAGQRTAFG